MADIYVFSPDEESNDYSTMGLVGALTPTKCEFKEVANGESTLTMNHPLDQFGRYKALTKGNIIVAPVPVIVTPEIQNGSYVTTVWTYKVKAEGLLSGNAQRTLYKKQTGSGKKKVLPYGEEVTVVSERDSGRWKVKSRFGTGWIDPNGFDYVDTHLIDDNSQSIQEVQTSWSIMPQYFRIVKEQKTETEVVMTARHIRYDLLKNMTKWDSREEAKKDKDTPTEDFLLGDVLDSVLLETYAPHDFTAYTNVANRRAGLHYKRRNLIDVFINQEDGICEKFDVALVADNYDLYFLHDPGLNRGIRIEYGKNMLGVDFDLDDDGVVTRIIPVGETKDGEDLLLSDDGSADWVDSANIWHYPIIHVYELKVDNAKVGKEDGGKVTVEVARNRMREAALALIKNECDMPKLTMKVKYLDLGDTAEYSQFKHLESAFLWDYITIKHPKLAIDVTARITEITWDVMAPRMLEVTIGSISETLANSGIASWQIPGGINGNKIGNGTLGSGAFENDVISARHIQAETITAYHIMAHTITAELIATNGLIAQHIVAQVAEIVKGIILQADIGEAHIDYADIARLDALFANIANAEIGKAQIGWGQIYDLVTHNQIFTKGIGEQLFIERLAVVEANMVHLSLGNLLLKGSDGRFYEITVDAETGEVISILKQVGNDDVADKSIYAYEKIIDGTITARTLNVQEIFTNEMLFGVITGDHIHVRVISPAHVTDDFGMGIDISSNAYLNFFVKNDTARAWIDEGTRELRVTYDGAGTHLTSVKESTTMTARVYEANRDITGTIPAEAFIWTRETNPPEPEYDEETGELITPEPIEGAISDEEWNAQHIGTRQIRVAREDINHRSIISCTLLAIDDMIVKFEVNPDTLLLEIIDPPYGSDNATWDPATATLTINGATYVYDQLTQTIEIDKGLSASRTTVQYTFDDETGMYARILMTKKSILLEVDNELTEQRSYIEIELGKITAQVEQTITDAIDELGEVVTKTELSSLTMTPSQIQNLVSSTTSGLLTYSQMTQYVNSFDFELKDPSYNFKARISNYTDPLSMGFDYIGIGFFLGGTRRAFVGINRFGASNSLALTANYSVTVEAEQIAELQAYIPGSVGNNYISVQQGRIIASSSISVGSDKRLKCEIFDISSGESLFDGLSPKQYVMKSNPNYLHYGFIADEVEELLKKLGIEKAAVFDINPKDGYKLLNYQEFVALTVDKVQKLEARYKQKLQHQDKRIDDLQNEINDLKRQMTEIKALLGVDFK